MTNADSPERWSVNGEMADEDQIAFMEGLASDMLTDCPAQYTRQYGYATEAGSIALFSTIVFEDESEMGSHAMAMLAKDLAKNVIFAVPFGYNNMVGDTHFRPGSNDEIESTVRDLLDADDIDVEDRAILRHMQAIILGRAAGMPLDHPAILRSPNQAGDYQYVGDVIRSQVQKKAHIIGRSKDWGMELDNQHTIIVSSNELIGDLDDDDDPLILPPLEIEYQDHALGVTYKYIREPDGDKSLNSVVTTRDEDDYPLTTGDEDIEEQVAFFVSGLGASIPGEREVGIIVEALSQAILIKSPNR